jgi:hypothetical protein
VVTLYDTDTRSIILNEQLRSQLGSRENLARNADGSVDIYFAPIAPKGFENNWIQTVPSRAWFVGFRFYAPLEPYFDKAGRCRTSKRQSEHRKKVSAS